MKKRLLSAFLAVMMVLTMAPMAFAADNNDAVAKINKTTYSTLQDAITAANDGDTITLLKSGNGDGFKIPVGKFTDKGLTIDFDHFMYMIGGQLVGSSGSGTNACQLNANNKITFKNGSFVGATEGSKPADDTPDWHGAPAIMIQNYCDLTLENMIVTGGDETVYTFSNNCGNIVIKDSTINAGKAKDYSSAPFAFDVYGGFQSYGDVTVSVEGTSVINGDVEIDRGTANNNKNTLLIKGGFFNGNIKKKAGDVSVTGGVFSNSVDSYVATGYKAVELNGKNVVVVDTADTAVAELNDYQFTTVQNAINAAADADNDTVKLLTDTTEDITITDKVITLDMAGSTLTLPSDCGVSVIGENSKLTITGNGTMTCNNTPIAVNRGTVVIENGTITSANDYCTYAKNGGTIIVNGGTLTSQDAVLSGNNTTGNMNFIVNGGTLTAKRGPAIYQSGQCELTIAGGTLNGGISLRMGQVNISGGTINAATENLDMPTDTIDGNPGYAYSGNVWFPDALYVIGGTYPNGDAEHGNSLNLNITGGTFNCTNGKGSAVAIYDLGRVEQTENITISGDAKFATNCTTRDAYQVVGFKDLNVEPINGYGKAELVGKISSAISGGYFTSDPHDYVADGYTEVTSDKSGYDYMVVKKTPTGSIDVKTDVADPEVDAKAIPADKREEVTNAVKEIQAPTLGAAANAQKQTIDKDDAAELIAKVTDSAVDKNTAKLYVQTALSVTPTEYNDDTTKGAKKLKLDITPQYRIVASTADNADDIVLDGNNKNAQVVQVYQPMTLTAPTKITMPLPDGFANNGDELSVKHTKHDGTVEYYTGTVSGPGITQAITFTTNGFSTFEISEIAAKIGDVAYPTLKDAVDNVTEGKMITLVNNIAATDVATVAKTISFTVDTDGKTFDKDKNIVAGSYTTKGNIETAIDGSGKATHTFHFTYSKPSSGGSSSGGGSSANTFNVTTSAVNNGGVNASPSKAAKGKTITITLSPDKGYKLDKLTVTDGSGKSIATTKKSDTVYTFTMPASQVKVGVSYVKIDSEPAQTTGYSDVAANDWFADAVQYVSDKGMMNGTGKNTFGPQLTTTRGMIVTVLYRLEKEPAASAASFTDVASGEYYTNAVAWANANGIVTGYGNGKFGPNDTITREQLAAILYRYAQFKKFGTSASADLNSYVDAQSVSSYAVPAVQWACGAGIVNGKTGNKLDPKGSATRAEVAAMLMRFCENVK